MGQNSVFPYTPCLVNLKDFGQLDCSLSQPWVASPLLLSH
jgi:hypothetical protein